MNDTGALGVCAFFLFLWAFFSDVFSTFRYNPNNILAKYAVAFSIGVFGLLVSYTFDNGLWLPFSWVFFGLTTALSCAARKQNMIEKDAANQ
jgi:branched-subunit amino acid transport protein AzlD